MSLVAWAPVPANRRVPGGAVLQIMAQTPGRLSIPVATTATAMKVYAEGPTPGSRGNELPCELRKGTLVIDVTEQAAGRWLYAIEQ